MADAHKRNDAQRRFDAAWNTERTRITLFMLKVGDLLSIQFQNDSVLILDVVRDADPLYEALAVFQVLNQSFSPDLVDRKLRVMGTGAIVGGGKVGLGKLELGKRVLLSLQTDERDWADFVPIQPIKDASLILKEEE